MFKYITCVGSRYELLTPPLQLVASLNTSHVSAQVVIPMAMVLPINGLNTSHVSVQAYSLFFNYCVFKFKYITCVGSSTNTVYGVPHPISFKYITCVGSRCCSK